MKLYYKFDEMKNSYFDIDLEGEYFIKIQQFFCSIIIKSASILSNQSENFKKFEDVSLDESSFQSKTLFEFSKEIELKFKENLNLKEKSNLLKEIINAILSMKLNIPQFYFKTKSNFHVQLEVDIDNNFYNGKPITTTIGKSIVIKASGLITSTNKAGLIILIHH